MAGGTSVDDLSMALRGMAVEDDYGARSAQQQGPSTGAARTQPPRGPYGNFVQDYQGYYSNTSGMDYSYGYAGSVDPNSYASPVMTQASPAASMYSAQGMMNSVVDMPRAQTGVFYDFSGSRPPASQFYYPAQAMMYSPVVSNAGEKKRESVSV